MSCQDHIIGVCVGTSIVSFDDPVVEEFLSNLNEFTTSKNQVNHPGFMVLARYCPECGTEIDHKSNKSQWDELIKTAIGVI